RMLLTLFMAHGLGAADPALADRVLRISQIEHGLPWFWSRTAEGLADIRYTYQQHLSLVVTGRRPTGLKDWRTLQLERIPLDWGSFMRCVLQDGRQAGRRGQLTPEDRARIDRIHEERRGRRTAFWDRFPNALKFESAGPSEISFSPVTPGPTLLRLEYDLP